jgi:hypothetical protein
MLSKAPVLAAADVPDETIQAPACIRGDGIHQGSEPSVLEGQDAVGRIQDPVVVRHEDHRHAIPARQALEQLEDASARLAIEGRGGLVGEDDFRASGECARDRHPLALPAGELARMSLGSISQSHGLESLVGPPPGFFRRDRGIQFERGLHVLAAGEGLEQVVGLEDVADSRAHLRERRFVGVPQLASEDAQASLLGGAQCADEREQRRLPGARGPGEDDDLALADLRAEVGEHLPTKLAFAEGVGEMIDDDRRFAHPKTSAGSAERTLRSAIRAATPHMPTVRAKTTRARSGLMTSGRRVACAVTR